MPIELRDRFNHPFSTKEDQNSQQIGIIKMSVNKKIKIFISYASEDVEFAEKIYLKLKSIPNFEPWFGEESLLPGEKWKIAIKNAIKETDFFLILLSKNSTTKQGFVQKELREALNILEEYLLFSRKSSYGSL